MMAKQQRAACEAFLQEQRIFTVRDTSDGLPQNNEYILLGFLLDSLPFVAECTAIDDCRAIYGDRVEPDDGDYWGDSFWPQMNLLRAYACCVELGMEATE